MLCLWQSSMLACHALYYNFFLMTNDFLETPLRILRSRAKDTQLFPDILFCLAWLVERDGTGHAPPGSTTGFQPWRPIHSERKRFFSYICHFVIFIAFVRCEQAIRYFLGYFFFAGACGVISQKTSTSYRVSSFPSCLAPIRFSTCMRERHAILSRRPFFPTSESVRFSGNHAILEIIDKKCDSRLNIYIIVCILKCLDIMESGLTEKQKEPPPQKKNGVISFGICILFSIRWRR